MGIRQSRQASAAHSHRQVVTLDVGRANEGHIWVAPGRLLLGTGHGWWRVAALIDNARRRIVLDNPSVVGTLADDFSDCRPQSSVQGIPALCPMRARCFIGGESL